MSAQFIGDAAFIEAEHAPGRAQQAPRRGRGERGFTDVAERVRSVIPPAL